MNMALYTHVTKMINNPLIGKDLALRALEPEDLELLYLWENDMDIWNVSNTLVPVSRYILKKYLENAHKDIYETKQLRLIIQLQENNRAIGTIDLFDFDPYHKRAGVGILIADKGDRRKGYAREALDTLVSYAFNTLNLHLVYCTISTQNSASLELFRQAGFDITGTKKEWIWDGDKFLDEHFLQIVK